MSTTKTAKNVRKIYHTWKDTEGVLHTDKRRVVATVETLKDGTKRITRNGTICAIMPDGTVGSEVFSLLRLEKWNDGKWRVSFSMDYDLANILDILDDCNTDFDGPLADAACGGIASGPLNDAQAAKVREYFIPAYLTEAK